MSIKQKRIACIVAAIFAALWLVFVWPTPYRYFKSGSTNYRVNRFTGDTEHLTGSGWQ